VTDSSFYLSDREVISMLSFHGVLCLIMLINFQIMTVRYMSSAVVMERVSEQNLCVMVMRIV
jgi:hypothetical protein